MCDNEMIERCTIAGYNKFNENLIGCCEPTWEELPEDFKDRMKESFVAMVKALREPTEKMKRCSEEIHWGYSCHVCGGLQEGWYAMIDAILND